MTLYKADTTDWSVLPIEVTGRGNSLERNASREANHFNVYRYHETSREAWDWLLCMAEGDVREAEIALAKSQLRALILQLKLEGLKQPRKAWLPQP